MQKLMLTAAFAALMAVPAFAQPDHHRGGPQGGPQGGPPAPQAAPAQPAPPAGRNRADFGHGAMHGQQPAPGAAPAAQAQGRPQGGNNGNWQGRHDDHRDNNWQNNNNRPGFNPGNNTRPSPGFNNNNRPGNRPNYSGFNRYHQNYNASRRFHAGSYSRPSGWYYRRWTFGQVLPSLFWAQQYWLNDYISYDLPPPPPGAVWVRNGSDALLIDRYSGEIITVEYSVFY